METIFFARIQISCLRSLLVFQRAERPVPAGQGEGDGHCGEAARVHLLLPEHAQARPQYGHPDQVDGGSMSTTFLCWGGGG